MGQERGPTDKTIKTMRRKTRRQYSGGKIRIGMEGLLLCGLIPVNEAVSYAHHNHQSIFTYDPQASASKAYAKLVGQLVRQMAKAGV